jgi:hypothetical protein
MQFTLTLGREGTPTQATFWPIKLSAALFFDYSKIFQLCGRYRWPVVCVRDQGVAA